MNNTLTGVVIDPGHGGVDSGAKGNNNLEKDYSLKISKYMYDRFKELGIPVYITRDSDITLTPTDRVNKIINAFGNDPNVIVISNHLNAGGGTGAEVIYALRNTPTLASKILENIGKTGQKTRRYYQRVLPSDPSKDYYFINRNTGNTESLIVEYGFIDDNTNSKFLNDNYKQLAEAVIEAITDYKGIPYISPFENNNMYIVKKGDTLYSIANKFNTTVDTLKRLNNLTTNTLSIGQILILPTNEDIEIDTIIYTIKKGDTLYSIANKYNTTVDTLKRLNNLTTNDLKIGDTLIIPSSIIEEEIEIPELPSTNTYTVKSGDTLYSIANKYKISANELKELNNLTSNLLRIGQVLIVPPLDNTINTYIVEKGDTLYSIARKFNTTVNILKELNSLTKDILSIGQTLKIK